MFSFLSALLISLSILVWRLVNIRFKLRWKDLVSGVALGFVNYGSVYFLIRALSVPGWQSSQLFPTISISVVAFSSLGAWAFFNERLTRLLLFSLVIGVVSIILINI